MLTVRIDSLKGDEGDMTAESAEKKITLSLDYLFKNNLDNL